MPDQYTESEPCASVEYSGTMQSAEHRDKAEQPKALTPSGAWVKSIHSSYIIKSSGDQLTEPWFHAN